MAITKPKSIRKLIIVNSNVAVCMVYYICLLRIGFASTNNESNLVLGIVNTSPRLNDEHLQS
jgi:hypothetical protein